MVFIMKHLQTRIKILPSVTVTQIYGVTGFIIFPFSTLSLHCHYFAFLFRPSLLAFEVADCISA